ncbi:MAG: hypothetical protein J5755_05995, partial [Clostridia bacterium]|nr:hypothetical protein [Clostridia bacterium]
MKSKLFLIIMTLCLVLCVVCCMSACDLFDKGGNGDNGQSGEQGGEQGGGQGGGQSGGFDYQASAIATRLDAMRQGNGYLLRFEVEAMENLNASTITLAAKGDIYYVAVNDDECFYDASASDHMDYYEKRNAEAEWGKHTMAYSTYYTREQALDSMKAYIESNSLWLSYYDGFGTSLEEATKTSATLLGRACDKYTFTAAALGMNFNMVTAHYECYVDKQTSICLKWHYSAIADGESASWTMECTEFNTNPTLTLPQVAGGEQGGGEQGGGNGNADTHTVQMASR